MFNNKPHLCRVLLTVFCLAFVRPALADPPPAVSWHTISMDGLTPADFLRVMHWGAPTKPVPLGDGLMGSGPPMASGTLPKGVRRVYASEDNRTLLFESTPEGAARVFEIIRNLHIVPRQMQFKIQFVAASSAAITSLPLFAPADSLHRRIQTDTNVPAALQSLLAGGGTILKSCVLSTSSGGGVSVSYREPHAAPSHPLPPPTLRLIQKTLRDNSTWPREVWIMIHPRLNIDDTMGLALEASWEGSVQQDEPDETPDASPRTLGILTKIPSGAMLTVGGLLSGNGQELLVFITPTVLPQEPAAGNETGPSRGMIQSGPNVSVAP